MRKLLLVVLALGASSLALAQETTDPPAPSGVISERDLQIRTRYEKALVGSPLQDQAFDRIYESYLAYEGIDAWVEKLKTASEAEQPNTPYLILLGRVYARQFKNTECIAALEQALAQGESAPDFKLLLGTTYYEAGRDADAITQLSAALDSLEDSDKRGKVCRLLGTLYQRQGDKDQAIAAWKRLTENNPDDTFAILELAAIYEENRMWDEAIGTYTHLVDISASDPYRQCRALRSIGQAKVQQEKYTEAVATFEKALELVAPGNWLFEDLKQRLVSVYQDMGDLQGLVDYVQARLTQAPGDIEMRDLLAETFTRMNQFDSAEAEYNQILERDPQRGNTYEKLLALHERQEKHEAIAATYEKLIELFPSEPDYIRRLGEFHLQQKNPDLAKTTWQRLTATDASPGNLALLAEWYEDYEFPDEAIAMYQQAIAGKTDKEWSFRLADLTFQKGDESGAIAIWQGVLDDATSGAADYAEVAGILEGHNLSDKAEPLLAKAIEKDPANMDYALSYARNLMRQERAEEALPQFEKLAAQTDNDYFQDQGERGILEAYSTLGILQEKQQEWEQEAIDNPDDHVKLARLGRMQERLGDRPKAITLYERCTELAPEDSGYLRTLAAAYRANKQIQETLDVFQKLIDMEPDRAGGYYRELLSIYMEADMRDQALATAQKVVESAPSDPEARLDLAQVYQNYQQPEKALEQYRYALRLEPNEPDYFRQYGDALMAEQQFGEAQEAFRKMMAVAQEDQTRRTAIVRMANIYQQQGSIDELIGELNGRIRNTPKKLAAYEDLAAVHANLGDNASALTVLETGLDTVDDKAPALQSLVRASYDAQDLPKVVSYFEQLIAMSGKPTAQEYERLGSVYAQLGEQDKARETWDKIVEENKDDPKAYVTLARALSGAGFTEEALGAKAKALELDPMNIRLRFEYAQELSGAGQTDEAFSQLQQLLEYGDIKQKEEEEASKEKKVKQLNRGGNSYQSLRYASRGYLRGVRSFSGSFAAFRPDIVTTMVAMADNSIGIDSLLEDFRKKVEENPSNYEARKDLITALRSANRPDEAIQAVEELLQAQPDDIELLETVSTLYVQLGDPARAIEAMVKIGELQPIKKKDVQLAILPLRFQAQQIDEGKAMAQEVLTTYPDDYQAIFAVLNVYQEQGMFDEIKALRPVADTIDKRYRQSMLTTIAAAYKQTGDHAESANILQALLDDPDPAASIYSTRQRQARLFVVSANDSNNMPRYSGPMGSYHSLNNAGVISSMNYTLANVAAELLSSPDETVKAAALARFEAGIQEFTDATSSSARQHAWNKGKLLVTHYLGANDNEKAEALLDAYHAAGMNDIEWYNLKIYLASQAEDKSAMLALYDQAVQNYPSLSRDAARARVSANLIANNYEAAAAGLREQMARGLPPAQVLEAIQQFEKAGEKELTKALLEEHLAGMSRNSAALSMLASIYSEEDNLDKAIELAREAWNRRVQGSSRATTYYNSYGGVYFSGGMMMAGGVVSGPDDVLRRLHGYMAAANRTSELVAEFEESLAKQPGSIELHRNLATLYQLNNDVDKALAVWEKLIEKRPNYAEAKMTRAQMLVQKGRFDEALVAYEDMITKNPSLYRRVSWNVRDLYQRMGKGEDLAKMEESMVAKATSPDQMRDLARRFQEEGDYDQAAELYKKAIRLQPNQSYINNELANVYVAAGRVDDAITAYADWLNSPITRSQGYIDSYAIDSMIGLYRASGRLDEVKTKIAEDLQKNPNDKIAIAIDASIAKIEKRFDDAWAGYESLFTKHRDNNSLNSLMDIAELRGDSTPIFKFVEENNTAGMFFGERLPLLYLAAGDRDKAFKAWKDMGSRYGGAYGYREVLQQLVNNGLWEEAEAYYTENRKAAESEQWIAEEMDEIASQGYAMKKGFEAVVDRLRSEPIKGSAEKLLEKIVSQMRQNPARCREFLAPIVEANPDNAAVMHVLAGFQEQERDYESALALRERIVELEPENGEYRASYARCLAELGRADEAEAMLREWYPKRLAERGEIYVDFLFDQGYWKQIVELKAQAMPNIDPALRDQAEQVFISREESMGNIEAAESLYRTRFEEKQDAPSFRSYYEVLLRTAQFDKAMALYDQHKDDGFLDQWGGSNRLTDLCLLTGQTDRLLEHAWNFTRYGDRYNREYYLREVVSGLKGLYNLRKFYDPFMAKVMEEPNPTDAMKLICAKGYADMGDHARAAEIYRGILDRNPLDDQARRGLIAALSAQGLHDEQLAMVSDTKYATTLQNEMEATVLLASTYFDLGRADDAMRTITDMQTWAGGGQALSRIGGLLAEHGRYEEALPVLERAVKLSQSHGAKEHLAHCYAKAGRFDEAFQVVESGTQEMNAESFLGWLITEKIYDGAELAARRILEVAPGAADTYMMLMRCHIKSGNVPAFLQVMEEATAVVNKQTAKEFCESAARDLCYEPDRVEAVFAAIEAAPTDAATTTLAALFAQRAAEDMEEAALTMRDRIAALPMNQPEAMLFMAEGLAELGDTAAANEWRRKAAAIPGKTRAELIELGNAMVDAGDVEGAKPVFTELVAIQPTVVVREEAAVLALAHGADAAALDSLRATLAAYVPYEPQIAFYNALIEYENGDRAAGLEAIAAQIDSPMLTHKMIDRAARIMKDNGRPADARRAYDRIANGGFGTGNRLKALQDAIELEAPANPAAAIALYAKLMTTAQEESIVARHAIADHVTTENLPAVREAVVAAIAENPAHDRASDLVGFYVDLARAAGAPEAAATLTTAAQLTGVEAEEALAWDTMILDWLLVGPFDSAYSGRIDGLLNKSPDFEGDLVAQGADAIDPAKLPTVQVDPASVLRMVEMDRAFKLGSAQRGGKFGYAITTVVSPDDRSVTFDFGADDMPRVWVNGTKVYERLNTGSVVPGQEQFTAQLHSGENTIVIRIANASEEWAFYTGFNEGGEGLTTAAPKPGSTAVAQATN